MTHIEEINREVNAFIASEIEKGIAQAVPGAKEMVDKLPYYIRVVNLVAAFIEQYGDLTEEDIVGPWDSQHAEDFLHRIENLRGALWAGGFLDKREER